MWRYLKAAFLVGIPVPGMGRLPLNAMAAFAVTALGFVEPSVWLAGIGIEVALVGSLAFNTRFQRVVDARALPPAARAEADKRAALVASLPPDLNTRLSNLHATSARVLSIGQKLGAEPELMAGTEASLDKLQWIYLKLLIARDHLVNDLGNESAPALTARIYSLTADLSATANNSALQRSQSATLDLLKKRLQNLNNRDHLLRENESDLTRIENQIALMRQNAAIEGKPAAVDLEIEFASDLHSQTLFGVHGSLVSDLDRAHSHAGII